MKKIIYLLLIILFSIFLTSCTKYSEIHEISFVISLGFDYDNETSEYIITSYIINNANLTQNKNQSTDTSSYIGSYKDKSITEALNKLTSNVDITLEFKHIKTVFINKDFLTKDNMEYLYVFFRNGPLFYPNFEVYITENKIEDIFKVQVFEETTLFYTLLTGQKKAHNHETITFFQLINDKLIPNFYLGYPIVKVTTEVFENKDENYHTTEIIASMYLDDELNKYIVTYKEFPGLYLIHQTTNLLMTLKDIEFLIDNYKFNVIINQNQENSFKIRINAEIAYIYSDNYTLFNYKSALEQYIKEEIQKLYDHFTNLGIDLFNINYKRQLKQMDIIDLKKTNIIFDINLMTP